MKKRLFSLLLVLAMMLSITACGGTGDTVDTKPQSGGDTPSSTGTPDATTDEPVLTGTCQDTGCVWDAYTPMKETVTFTKGIKALTGSEGFNEGDGIENNVFTRYVEQAVNVKTEVAWEVAANNYDQKVSLSIAAGDIPDMMIVTRSVFEQLVENDLIMDLTEVYDKCISDEIRAQIDSYGQRLMDEVTVDGKMMAIPGTSIGGQWNVLWIRQDWLDKLGLEVPTTVDEIIEVARAFVENDMAGNGKTVGLPVLDTVVGGYNSQYGLYTIFSAFDAWPGNWIERDGKVVYGSVQPEVKDVLQLLSEMYADGLIDKEFAIRKGSDRNELVVSGQCGMAFLPWYGGAFMNDSVKNDPEAEWTIVSAPVGEDGKLHVFSQDPVNGFLVIRKDYEHPEAIIKALNAGWDASSGRSVAHADAYEQCYAENPGIVWSVEPVPLQVDYDNALEIGYEKLMDAIATGSADAYGSDVQRWYSCYQHEQTNPKEEPAMWREALMRTEGVKAAIIDPYEMEVLPFYGRTETMSQKWTNLQDLELDMMLKIIMGEASIDEFDKFVENWHAMGGDQITAEVQAAVDAKRS